MNITDKVAVCSRSFSKNHILRKELLKKYKNVTFNDEGIKLEGESLINFLNNHDKAITALEKIDESVIQSLPLLRVISKYGVGIDMIDLDAMRKYNKCLGWESGVNKRSASELTLAFMILSLRKVIKSNREILSGTWRQVKGNLLTNKTIGIIGCGNIGKDLITLLKPFKVKLLAYDILNYEEFYKKNEVKAVSKEELLKNSDIVTLHIPLTKSTRNIISSKELKIMKTNSILINNARGGIVDEAALKKALINNEISSAAFDVFEPEPPIDSELLSLDNFLCTSHIGGSAEEAIIEMGRAAIRGLDKNNIPQNI